MGLFIDGTEVTWLEVSPFLKGIGKLRMTPPTPAQMLTSHGLCHPISSGSPPRHVGAQPLYPISERYRGWVTQASTLSIEAWAHMEVTPMGSPMAAVPRTDLGTP